MAATMMINSPNYRGINSGKIKYYVKTENFILWVVSCVKSITSENLRIALNDHELSRIRYLKRWTEHAPLEEIMGVMNKLGFEMFYGGAQRQKGERGKTQKRDAYHNGYEKTKKVDDLTTYAADNKYFIVASRDFAKTQLLFSQVVNGAWYVPNRDYKALMKVMKQAKKTTFDKTNINEESQNMKAIIRVFANFLLTKNEFVSDLELGILFYFADNDDAPIPASKIYEVFLFITKDTSSVTRSLVKLRKAGFLEFFGSKKSGIGTTYTLTYKGWQHIGLSIREFIKNIKFWDLEDLQK